MELLVSAATVICAVISIFSFFCDRFRRREDAHVQQRLFKAGCFAAAVLGIVCILTRK